MARLTLPPPRRVTYSHPSLPLCGAMAGEERWDGWELEFLFFPDEVHHAQLLSKYGYEPEAGLFLEGATVSPLSLTLLSPLAPSLSGVGPFLHLSPLSPAACPSPPVRCSIWT